MKKFKITKLSGAFWSTNKLMDKAEVELNELTANGYEIFDISFGYSTSGVLTCFITYTDTLEMSS